jgi:hypothetical protein
MGPWRTEVGWGTPWIAGALALRQMHMPLWELTAAAGMAEAIEKYRSSLFP